MDLGKLIDKEMDIAERKRFMYVGECADDLFAVRRIADFLGISPQRVILVLMMKHLAAIDTLLENGNLNEVYDEIEERLIDLRIYAFLLLKSLLEEKEVVRDN